MLETDLIPARDAASKRLMIVLHGLGDSMEGFRWLPGEMRLPWLNYLLVNAPDEYFGGYSWYDIYEQPEPGIVRSRGLLAELLRDLPRRGFALSETVLLGFSQGCLMTIEMGARHPERFAGCVGISGYVHAPEILLRELSSVAREQRFLLTHGTHDPLLPMAMVRRHVQALQQGGLNVEWHEFEKDHTIAGEAELSVIRRFVERSYPTLAE
jgi:phospholipase/carboxylesterase